MDQLLAIPKAAGFVGSNQRLPLAKEKRFGPLADRRVREHRIQFLLRGQEAQLIPSSTAHI